MAEDTRSTPASETAVQTEPSKRTGRLTKVGRVKSDKMNKTVVVTVDYSRRHRLYSKVMTRTSAFKAHDENNEFKAGDLVEIQESAPIAKTKAWRVTRLVEKGRVI